VLIIAYMMSSSSSAYGSSFHDNGDGDDNKKNFFTPGKRKSTRDDDDDDGNDNGAPNGDQEAKMTPKGRCKTWCGHTASWHYEQVGPELQSVLQANHPQPTRRGLQREQRFHSNGCPGIVEGAHQNTPGAPWLHSMQMHGLRPL
jgi:hypothetical protein